MIDTVRINVKAGNGGDGCMSFRREKHIPRGGPDGGDGGTGGSAYVCGDPSINTLLHLKFNSTFYVERGAHGKGKNQRGGNGAGDTIKVPEGTVVWRLLSGRYKELLVDVVDSTPHLVARGGVGGRGNARYVSPTNQEPVLAEKGERGEKVNLVLELKLLSDVGVLARPNAGKSTLIARCSAARPKVADYPFTTTEPVLGTVNNRGKDFVMMEIPGLIEGAHKGVGLGHEFLRHAERTRLYLHLVDGLAEDPVGDFRMLNRELRLFNESLAQKRQIVCVNKVDVTEVRQRRETLKEELWRAIEQAREDYRMAVETEVLFISAATGEGVDTLLGKTVELLDRVQKETPEPEMVLPPAPPPHPATEPDTVRVEGGIYIVDSLQLERLAARADTRDRRVLLQLWREMTHRGVAQRLEEAGITAGDTIRIGQVEMEWF